MSKITHILLEDEDERYGPPEQPLLKLSYHGPGPYQVGGPNPPALIYLDVVKCGDLNAKTGDYDYASLGAVCVTAESFEAALALLKANEAREGKRRAADR